MTENKQFKFDRDTVAPNIKTPIVFKEGERLSIGEVLDKLNELNDENEQLKCTVYSYKCSTETDRELIEDLHEEYKALEKKHKKLKKQLKREETDKKRLMSYLLNYTDFIFDEIIEDILEEPNHDKFWEGGYYEDFWRQYLKEKGFDGCDEE